MRKSMKNKDKLSLDPAFRHALMIEQASFFKTYIQHLRLLAEESLQEFKEASSNKAISYPW